MQVLTIKPSQQGHLDNLCGLYSVVNAVAFLHQGSRKLKRKSLKMALIRAYSERSFLDDMIYSGLDTSEMDDLLTHVVSRGYYHRKYPVIIEKPFEPLAKISTKELLETIRQFLALSSAKVPRIALIGTVEHWTLIHKIDDEFVYLFDSAGRTQIKRKSIALRAGRARHVLDKHSVYFMIKGREVL